jgi:hypothetical protein
MFLRHFGWIEAIGDESPHIRTLPNWHTAAIGLDVEEEARQAVMANSTRL